MEPPNLQLESEAVTSVSDLIPVTVHGVVVGAPGEELLNLGQGR